MKTQKMSLASMQGKLSRAEMKGILGGDDVKACSKAGDRCTSNAACCSKVCLNTDGESGKSRCQR